MLNDKEIKRIKHIKKTKKLVDIISIFVILFLLAGSLFELWIAVKVANKAGMPMSEAFNFNDSIQPGQTYEYRAHELFVFQQVNSALIGIGIAAMFSISFWIHIIHRKLLIKCWDELEREKEMH